MTAAAMLAFVLLVAPTPSRAGGEWSLTKCSEVLRDSSDPIDRIAAVRRMAEIGSKTVPGRLAKVIRFDRDPALRIAAADVLGEVDVKGTPELLITLLREGGPRTVRETLVRSAAARGVSPSDLVAELDAKRIAVDERLLLVRAIGDHPSPLGAAQLEFVAATREGRVAAAAVGALPRDAAHRGVLRAAILEFLAREDHSPAACAEVVELAGEIGDREFVPALRGLDMRDSPALLQATASALARIEEWSDAGERRGGNDVGDRRREPRERRRSESGRLRGDVVHVVHLKKGNATQREELLRRMRADLKHDSLKVHDGRVGMVVYLDPSASTVYALPPTREESEIEAFLESMKRKKRGQRARVGTAMSRALERAYGATDWRWDAERTVVLHAAQEPHDRRRATAVVGAHFAADDTRIRVLWYGPTHMVMGERTIQIPIPRSMTQLAAAGGAGVSRVSIE